jgi:hypothetical protein
MWSIEPTPGVHMTISQRQLFPQFSTDYLKALGELLICGVALQSVLDAENRCSEVWRARAAELADEALRIGEAVAAAAGRRVVCVELADGSTVVADVDYVSRLVHKMHRHHSLGLLQLASAADKELITT